LPLLRPSIPIGWRLRLLREWLLANANACVSCGFVHATHATQAIAFEWTPGFSQFITNNVESLDTRSSYRFVHTPHTV